MIFLTSNILVLLFWVFLSNSSCSFRGVSVQEKQQEKSLPFVENLNRDNGPTKKNAFFQESSKKYGLQNKKGVRFYAVDFDLDNWTDLVILPDYFSVPEFYRFFPLQKKFIPLGHNPFGKNIQGSFLNFIDLDKDGLLDVIVATLAQKSELTQISLRPFKGVLLKGKIFYKEDLSGIEIRDKKRLRNFPLASLSVLDFDLDGKLDLFLGGCLNLFFFKIKFSILRICFLRGTFLSLKISLSFCLRNGIKRGTL